MLNLSEKKKEGDEAGCFFCVIDHDCEAASENNVGKKDSDNFVTNVIPKWQTAAPRDSHGIRDILAIQTFMQNR